MPLEGFRIEYDNPYRSYFPGQWVTGKVIINTMQPEECNGKLTEIYVPNLAFL